MTVVSRQGEPIKSCWMQARELWAHVSPHMQWGDTWEFVAEVTWPGHSFKDTSGKVRRQELSPHLVLNVFDAFFGDREQPFADRWATVLRLMDGLTDDCVRYVEQFACWNAQELHDELTRYAERVEREGIEGAVIRASDDLWEPGKRRWGYQKYVPEPTVDLEIVGVEEAISQHGKPLGMVGRLVALYRGEEIGVGPGKLPHHIRRSMWEQRHLLKRKPHIACIKYKPDAGYSKLRQPTFQHWRTDKVEPNEETVAA